MGQQQLLLLVLGIVIVGLAVVVGINAFSENRIKANADALVTDGLRIASDVQAYVLKPQQFGGGNDGDSSTDDLQTLAGQGDDAFDLIGYNTGGNAYTNVNGSFTIGSSACDGVTMPTGAASNGPLSITATNGDTGNEVCINITGTASKDIGTVVTYGSGASS